MSGSVDHAGWTFDWAIHQVLGEGLVISKAAYLGTSVLFRAGQPFALVPYHGDDPTWKDGLGASCDARPYRMLKPSAPNGSFSDLDPDDLATIDDEAVIVELHEPSYIEPAMTVVWAKFQAGNYQYIHHWEFHADGAIHAAVGMGGRLWKGEGPDGVIGGQAHIHNFYFRLDFDIVTPENNRVQRLRHLNNTLNGDVWEDIPLEASQIVVPTEFTTWRVINTNLSARAKHRSYELVPGSEGAPDGNYSSGDLWVVRYVQRKESGEDVGPDPRPELQSKCTDYVVGTNYVNSESVDNEDIVVWYCLRSHHVPRHLSEERTRMPYHFVGFHLQPRDFLDDTPPNLYAEALPHESTGRWIRRRPSGRRRTTGTAR
jgi:Cu2+-containing amine oxidase